MFYILPSTNSSNCNYILFLFWTPNHPPTHPTRPASQPATPPPHLLPWRAAPAMALALRDTRGFGPLRSPAASLAVLLHGRGDRGSARARGRLAARSRPGKCGRGRGPQRKWVRPGKKTSMNMFAFFFSSSFLLGHGGKPLSFPSFIGGCRFVGPRCWLQT